MAEGSRSMYGPLLIGTFLNCLLYGVTAIQTLVYFKSFKRDKWWIKMFVFYLLFFETVNTIFDIGVIYEPLIIRAGTSQATVLAPTLLLANPLITVLISLPVQLFIAWRVKVISKSIILPVIISFFAISSFAGGIATTITLPLIHYEFSRFVQNDRYVISWLASSAIADVLITASLVHSLLRKRTGFAATDDVINRIIRLTIHTGLITAVSAILDVTLFVIFRGKLWNFIFDFALSKLYSNTILSSLNARVGWKASSSIQENVLFGNETEENSGRTRTQIEVMTTVMIDTHPSRLSTTIPMKVLNPGARHHDSESSSALNVDPESGKAI